MEKLTDPGVLSIIMAPIMCPHKQKITIQKKYRFELFFSTNDDSWFEITGSVSSLCPPFPWFSGNKYSEFKAWG